VEYIIYGIYWQDLTHSAYNYPRFTLIKLYRETTTANIELNKLLQYSSNPSEGGRITLHHASVINVSNY
jgi:hypothetical protein